MCGEGTRDEHPTLLPSRELGDLVASAIGQPHSGFIFQAKYGIGASAASNSAPVAADVTSTPTSRARWNFRPGSKGSVTATAR